MIAALPMYQRAENAAAHAVLWALIRDGLRVRGIEAPEALDVETDHMEVWGRPDLVLSQICNLPYRAVYRERVTLIGASDYGLKDCAPGYYYSYFVVPKDDPASRPEEAAGYPLDHNDGLSQSGWGAAQLWAAERGFAFPAGKATGAHSASLARLAEGRGRLAAIDAVTWRNLERWAPEQVAAVKIIGRTGASPGQSFITRAGEDPAPYSAAIAEAIGALPAEEAATLGLKGIVPLPASAYDLPLPPKPEASAA
ncbi:phosphate/phosphite/phosphonate ABC transporter substrate-binding protein [Pseudoroseicyclus tamaricis]|uniref:Phosphate/phosphite/phosphonate ABC transporter substrate-binding protein n=1 Tax=Pseudoroseicyclus tamaricis TaxID=2705421 RepID=A0A6B2JTS7_9RHOB|nr:PhnD/SsuA/transferrin family substrate-binding protein [Pseudoroseicyclus tamaricis]NDV01688.1 phosphate/phosphite/phosphonate ABC transporter substrate-binding protein [Pseudoroseicyclus tamaricis]